jgi:lipopolysaccharide/colanic/teichoic acid biosynthesis glycosyltransferase
MQRLLDIIFSSIALFLLSPLLVITAVVLKLSGEGEVFFFQHRVGKNGKLFKLCKFATMLKNSPNIGGGTVTVKNDSRVLTVGRFLRKTKINELPQLFNIFVGDMSVVGPRPQTERCFNPFPPDLQKIIVQVKPGLSGIGPIVFRGEENIIANHKYSLDFYDQVIAPYKGQVEAWYVNHQTLGVYFSVIAVTVWVVLFPSSGLVWRVFKGLPIPPDELKKALNYSAE